MTIEEYYQNLLIIQYHDLPKAKETIRLIADVGTGDNIFMQLQDAFDVDAAIGEQLDLIGKIVGADRRELSDTDFRTLIKFKIIVNNADASMKSIDEAIYNTFGKSIVVSNNQDMTLTYIIEKEYQSVVSEAYKQGFLPVPMSVGLNVIIMVPKPALIFGFKRGNVVTNAIGFSNKDTKREATFLTKDNILSGVI